MFIDRIENSTKLSPAASTRTGWIILSSIRDLEGGVLESVDSHDWLRSVWK